MLPRPIAQEKSLPQSLLQGPELPAGKVRRPSAVPDPSAPGAAEPQSQREQETGVPQLAATDAAGGPSSAETKAAPRAGWPGTVEKEAPTARPCRPDPGLPDVGIRPDVRTPAHSLNPPYALIHSDFYQMCHLAAQMCHDSPISR
ncbi:translation initiation factor IF-2-like [Mirounga leonina]|uniref:translation initiation factor IF-2-like n=1 Tax=Mirounga leonina TaxID=9715 RepID=UPI00156C01ED|nr:translation initiation factor IF-2-like [Mirounga leonina]